MGGGGAAEGEREEGHRRPSGATQMDSTGIGIIAMCSGKLKKAGGELRVAGAKGVVEEVLKLTHMENIVSLHTTAAEAAAGFTSGRPGSS